jgi:hypothetical protein
MEVVADLQLTEIALVGSFTADYLSAAMTDYFALRDDTTLISFVTTLDSYRVPEDVTVILPRQNEMDVELDYSSVARFTGKGLNFNMFLRLIQTVLESQEYRNALTSALRETAFGKTTAVEVEFTPEPTSAPSAMPSISLEPTDDVRT